MNIAEVHASEFGASPSASGAENSAAINRAIAFAKENGNANVVLGPGVFEINQPLVYGGANQGITTIGVRDGSLYQGSGPGVCVLKWTGGAAPMIDVATTFHTFTGFSLQNNGSATHGIRAQVGGRLWLDRLKFSAASTSPFSVSSVEITGINYDRIRLCEFEAGPAVKILGLGTTLLIEQFMMESIIGSGAFIDIEGSLDVLTVREGTVNYKSAMATFIDMTNIGTARVSACRVANIEFDGGEVQVQETIAKVKNCDAFLFESNQVSSFGTPFGGDPPITATDSRVTLRNNVVSNQRTAFAKTLDATSYIYSYESHQDLTNTTGIIDAGSQSGNLIDADIFSTNVAIQGDRASAMAHAIYLATLAASGVSYTVHCAQVSWSSHQGFMTKGQMFTVVLFNNSGGTIAGIDFNPQFFVLCGPLAPPAPGARIAIPFYWDGAIARELPGRGSAA